MCKFENRWVRHNNHVTYITSAVEIVRKKFAIKGCSNENSLISLLHGKIIKTRQ